MRTLATLVLAALPALAGAQVCNPVCATQPSQCCNIPQNAPFMAYESDSRTSGIFRGIGDLTLCQVDTDIDPIAPVKMPLAPTPVSFTLPGGGTLSFKLEQLVEDWDTVNGPLGGGFCFSLRTQGFHTPAGPFTVTDGCGAHLISIDQPSFVCATPGGRFVCFKETNLNGNTLPLPPGFDRPEDVCLSF